MDPEFGFGVLQDTRLATLEIHLTSTGQVFLSINYLSTVSEMRSYAPQ